MKKLLVLALTVFALDANAASLATALTAKMDYLIARQNVVSSNIANASTPGFLAQDLVYQPASTAPAGLQMAGTNGKHLRPMAANSGFKTIKETTFVRNDGNSVRMDEQMLKMAKIQQEYSMATKLYSKHVALQKLAMQTK